MSNRTDEHLTELFTWLVNRIGMSIGCVAGATALAAAIGLLFDHSEWIWWGSAIGASFGVGVLLFAQAPKPAVPED